MLGGEGNIPLHKTHRFCLHFRQSWDTRDMPEWSLTAGPMNVDLDCSSWARWVSGLGGDKGPARGRLVVWLSHCILSQAREQDYLPATSHGLLGPGMGLQAVSPVSQVRNVLSVVWRLSVDGKSHSWSSRPWPQPCLPCPPASPTSLSQREGHASHVCAMCVTFPLLNVSITCSKNSHTWQNTLHQFPF